MTWRDKLAKWVEDNQDEIVKFTYYTTGLLVGAGGTLFFAKRNQKQWREYAKGLEICCGGMRVGSNDTIFDVYLKNDKVVSWTRPFVYKPRQ